jgi:signal transduction histidine kinase
MSDVTEDVAFHERHMNGGMLDAVTAPSAPPDLLVVPIVALLVEPMSPAELAEAASLSGLELDADRAERLLGRAATLGLARIAEQRDGIDRFVATSLGQRAGQALLAGDPTRAIGLEELERLRSELLANVGHELRTPLTAIRTSIGLLLDPGLEPSGAQRQQLLTTIGRSADRMQRLLGELLDLARLRSGRMELAWTSLDARDVAREVAAAVGPMAAARDQRLLVEMPHDPVVAWGDRGRLEQAVLNLVANAQKFSPVGADVLLRVAIDPDGRVRWSVIDHGPGIAPDEQERLFERFFVGTSDRTVAGGGTGIGLPMALVIAQAHGGTIEVDSEVGRGSAFHLVIEPGGFAT